MCFHLPLFLRLQSDQQFIQFMSIADFMPLTRATPSKGIDMVLAPMKTAVWWQNTVSIPMPFPAPPIPAASFTPPWPCCKRREEGWCPHIYQVSNPGAGATNPETYSPGRCWQAFATTVEGSLKTKLVSGKRQSPGNHRGIKLESDQSLMPHGKDFQYHDE